MTEIADLLNQLRKHIDDPTKGLPEEIFLFVSEITPMVNVDLLVRDEEGKVLLAWRNDPWYGSGWHVPGGIIRVKETYDDRIQRCAMQELHTQVLYNEVPLEIHPMVEMDFKERAHFFSFVYDCRVPQGYQIDNGTLDETDTGFLAWHIVFPDEMLRCHEFYRKYFRDG